MKTAVRIERWEWPIFKVEPSGFDHIEISLSEPSCQVEVKATIPLEDARKFGERLISLSQTLEKAPGR